MHTTEILRAEHAGVLMVLDQLERAVDAAERGAALPADIFGDIQEFFVVFVDRCHHGKEEEELFPYLEAVGSGDIATRLEDEHKTGRQLAAAYGESVTGYRPGQVATATRLASASRAYADFLRAHIDLETRELFPSIEDKLGTYDDALSEAFERVEVERIGAGTHERLHRMIEGLPKRIEPFVRPASTGR